MISSIISRLVILVFGTLYPAYASYKAVRTKNVKEYVKWMMYWIVFALFTCAETFTDVFCSFWFPFYYEFKVILVLWLLSPATKGSSILYRKFVHPMLTKREQEIDEYIAKAKEQGYHTVLTLGSKGVNYATTVIMQTAIKGGGGLVNQLRRSYSLSDISADMDALAEMNRIKALPEDELDLGDTPIPIADPRLRRTRGYSPRRSASGSGRVEMYFPEVDVNVRQRSTRPRETGIPLSQIRSNEDVSSGYSSAEMLYSGHPPTSEAQEPLVRTSSVGSSRVTRTKVLRGGAVPKRPTTAEDNQSWSESEGSDSGTQEEYFYEVPSSSPSEPVAALPSATLSEPVTPQPMGGDFKSHLPVALVCEPQEPEKYTECADNVQNSTTCEEQASRISLPANQERGVVNMLMEALLAEKYNVEYEKDNIEELKSVIRETNTECADNVQHLFITEEQASLISVPTNQEERGSAQLLMEVLQTEKVNFEELKSLTVLNDQLLESVRKEVLCYEEETPSFSDAVSFQDVTEICEITLARDIDSIPTTVESAELKMEENLSRITPQEFDESEFFDSENDFPQNSIAPTKVSNIPALTSDYAPGSIDEIHNENPLTENKSQKVVDEVWKDGRAGRYHKHPAPCPPPQPNTGVSTREAKDGSEVETIPEPVALDRKSPSPSSVSRSPQPSPNIGKKNASDDLIGSKSNVSVEQILPSIPVDVFEDAVNTQYNVKAAHVEQLDVKPSGADYTRPTVLASPNQKRKESKPKHDSTIMSRLLSKPKNQLASFFPFLSNALTTSLTSLDVGDLRTQDRARSSSIVGNAQARSDYMSVPPELPPRRKTPDNTNQDSTRMNIREMSHSPPRRHAN